MAQITRIRNEDLDRFYPEACWELSQAPCIPVEFSSRYVERIVNERRAWLKLPPYAAGLPTE